MSWVLFHEEKIYSPITFQWTTHSERQSVFRQSNLKSPMLKMIIFLSGEIKDYGQSAQNSCAASVIHVSASQLTLKPTAWGHYSQIAQNRSPPILCCTYDSLTEFPVDCTYCRAKYHWTLRFTTLVLGYSYCSRQAGGRLGRQVGRFCGFYQSFSAFLHIS